MGGMIHSCSQAECQSINLLDHRRTALLSAVLSLVLGFAGLEWLVGHLSHSLSLQSDAGHMVADGGAIAIALIASAIARLPLLQTRPLYSRRLETGAALLNGIALVAIAGMLAWEAVKHITAPPTEILSLPMMLTALIGVMVNGISAWLLHRQDDDTQAEQPDLNLRGAFLHILADFASSFSVLVGAIAIALFHWFWLDGLISLTVALLILSTALPLIRQCLRQWRNSPQNSPQVALQTLGFLEIGQADLATILTTQARDSLTPNQPFIQDRNSKIPI